MTPFALALWPHLFSSVTSRSDLLPLHLRLVRPHKVTAVQERYAAYGDRVEIGPVDDLTKGDLTDGLKGTYIEWANGVRPLFFEALKCGLGLIRLSSFRRWLFDSSCITIAWSQ